MPERPGFSDLGPDPFKRSHAATCHQLGVNDKRTVGDKLGEPSDDTDDMSFEAHDLCIICFERAKNSVCPRLMVSLLVRMFFTVWSLAGVLGLRAWWRLLQLCYRHVSFLRFLARQSVSTDCPSSPLVPCQMCSYRQVSSLPSPDCSDSDNKRKGDLDETRRQ